MRTSLAKAIPAGVVGPAGSSVTPGDDRLASTPFERGAR